MTKKVSTSPDPEGNSKLDPENELIASTKISEKCDLEVLPLALKIAKNSCKDLSLRHDALKIILKTVSFYQHVLKHESVVSDLKHIALESCDDERNALPHFCLKRYAFQCLKSKINDLPDDFYRAYNLHVKDEILRENNLRESVSLNKLNDYVEGCEKIEKFRTLEALSVALTESSGGLKMNLFNYFSPRLWSKESLVYALLSNNNSWDMEQAPRFATRISALDDFIKESNTRHCIEDVLKMLIDAQKECKLDITFINHILNLIDCNIECLDVITEDFCFLPTIINKLAILRVKKLCDSHEITGTDDETLAKLHCLLLYSEDAIASLFAGVKPNTPITDLISFLQLLKNSDLSATWRERFLLGCDRVKKSCIADWKEKVYLQFVENAIRREFPKYNPFLASFDVERSIDQRYFQPLASTDVKKHTTYSQCNDRSKANLNKSLASTETKSSICKILHEVQKKMSRIFLNCDWTNESQSIMETLIKSLDSEEKIVRLTNALDILLEYEIKMTDKNIRKIFSQSRAIDVQMKIHSYAIDKAFPGTYKKPFDQLIEELVQLNASEEIGTRNIKELLMTTYADVMEAYCGKSELLPSNGAINTWKKGDVEKWVEKLAGHPQRTRVKTEEPLQTLINGFLCDTTGEIFKKMSRDREPGSAVTDSERIAVITKTAELISGFPLRETQLLSVILLLNAEPGKGRLAQINTGEGKTMIIAMIAAYHATKGTKVDVITSSPLLAKPQSKEQRPFYAALGLTVDHNIDNHNEGYDADVVYGTSQAFQGDILRDEFRKRNTRRGRTCNLAIVDEVDNMLVDGNNYIVMLSADMPAMDHLEGVLAAISIQINHAAKSIVCENGKAYSVIRDNAYNEEGEAKKEVTDTWLAIESVKDFLTDCADNYIRLLIRQNKPEEESFPELKIPKHLRELVCETQLKKWIERAIEAKFNYVKDKDYILKNGDIKIVDAANTGVVRNNSQWSHALHQFLQIKHGAKIVPENLTTNLISNVSFFKRYPPKLYGLTGTLGTNGTKELLSRTYGVDSVIVPPFKLKRHRELRPIIIDNRDDWYKEIARNCIRKLINGRAALIIMEYINDTLELEKILKDYFGYDSSKIKLYKTEDDAAVINSELKAGHVIITTNIAGRGTDVKLSKEIDVNGGLHVCITFLPQNSRVELQNMGRTSRTGNRGTSQFVLCDIDENDIVQLKANRGEKEIEAMKRADKEIVTVTTKDMIFQKFCRLIDSIKGRNSFTKEVEKQAVEERFAIWLEINDEKIGNDSREKIFEYFENFEKLIKQDDANGRLIKNPYMYVALGNKYLRRKNYNKAIGEYNWAISLDADFAEHARYNRGYAYIAEYGRNLSNSIFYIDKAADDFKEARRLIRDRQDALNLIQTASDGEILSQQVRNKLNLYSVQQNAIDVAIGPDVEALERRIKDLKEHRKSDKLKSEDKTKIDEDIEALTKQKEFVGVIYKARSAKNNIEIELKDLKDSLPEDDYHLHETEIEELERNGFIGEFAISEVPPIDWSAVIGLLLLGFAQLVGGAALCIFTLGGGASLGAGLMSEGISDIITAVKDGIINRNFSWATWAIEKAISITVSIVCAGLQAIKNSAKAAWASTKAAGKGIGTLISKGASTTFTVGWKLVAKRVGWELAKGVGKEITKGLINYGIDKTMIPLIEEAIVDRIRKPIQDALTENPMVAKMLELDEKVNKNHYYENLIIAMGREILNPQTNRTLTKIGLEVATRIADNKVKHFAVARQVAGALNGLWEINVFVKNFVDNLHEKISEEARKMKIDEKSVETIAQENQEGEAIIESDSRKGHEKDIDPSRAHVKEEQVKLDERPPRSSKAIAKVFVKDSTTSMLNIIKGKIVAPVVNAGVDYGAKRITASIDESMAKEEETMRSQNRVIARQNAGYQDPKEPLDMINTNADRQAALNKADELIAKAYAGEPAGLVESGALSEVANCKLDVHNEHGQYMYTIGEHLEGPAQAIEYHEPKNGDDVGHWTLPGGREPAYSDGGRNMCFYNVVGELTGRDPRSLRNATVEKMANGRETLARQSSDIAHLDMYSRISLSRGGAVIGANNPDEMTENLRKSNGQYGFQNKKGHKPRPGHPGHHIAYKGTTDDILETTSAMTKTKIEIYDKDGNLLKTYGNNFEGDPVKMEYRKPEGNTSEEYLTNIGGPEKRRLNDPRPDNTDFWDTFCKEIEKREMRPTDPTSCPLYDTTGTCIHDPETLQSEVRKTMDAKEIPPGTYCAEEASMPQKSSKRQAKKNQVNRGKTAFINEAEAGYVTFYAMQLDVSKAAVAKLNEYEPGVKDSAEYVSAELEIKAEDLYKIMPRMAFGAQYVDGKCTGTFPITGSIFIKVQHVKGKETDRNATVHYQTSFTRPPPENEWIQAKKPKKTEEEKKKL